MILQVKLFFHYTWAEETETMRIKRTLLQQSFMHAWFMMADRDNPDV